MLRAAHPMHETLHSLPRSSPDYKSSLELPDSASSSVSLLLADHVLYETVYDITLYDERESSRTAASATDACVGGPSATLVGFVCVVEDPGGDSTALGGLECSVRNREWNVLDVPLFPSCSIASPWAWRARHEGAYRLQSSFNVA